MESEVPLMVHRRSGEVPKCVRGKERGRKEREGVGDRARERKKMWKRLEENMSEH